MPLKPMNSGRGKVSCLILKLPIVWVMGGFSALRQVREGAEYKIRHHRR
ncbi:Uncharacterised protein [Escherichia coli]|uniref:Uncharacterized protein n=1 Tax=Escherichia coli TaxID=562 RepID=A0A2X1LJ79_ECOLX|nr:Uncharacterised protein [Escherichia coli]